MKLLAILMFVSLLNAAAFPQNTDFSYNFDNARVEEVLARIENDSEFKFLYRTGQIDVDRRVNVQVRKARINQLLSRVFNDGTQFEYLEHNMIVLLPQNLQPGVVQVSGIVTSREDGSPLIGVTVVEKGTANGTVTGLDGNYILSVNEGAILEFSYVGYQTIEVPSEGRNVINVPMVLDIAELEELVVIGYGTVRKSDLTGSVAALNDDDFNSGVNSSVEDMILGRSAGVQVIQSSAEPGGGMSIRIRGAGSINAGSDPLYVIDGLPIDNGQVTSGTGSSIVGTRTPRNPLSTINPSDIESIEILKDASATAIYGARGANGVVMITTKKGSRGKLQVNYSGYTGIQSPANKLDLLSAEEYQSVLNELIEDGGGISEEAVTEIQDGGTNWQDEVMRNAQVQSHNLSLGGGNENTSFYASLNYFDQQGIVVSSGMERYDARFNLDHKIKDKFHTGLNITTSYTYDDYVPHGYAINENAGAMYAAMNFDPTLRVYNDDGTYQTSPFISTDNPLALAYGEETTANTYRTMGTLYGEYFILPEWSVKVNLGGDIQSRRQDSYVSELTKDGAGANGVGTVNTGFKSNYLIEATTHYLKDFNDNNRLDLLLGITRQQFVTNRFSGSGSNFANQIMQTNSMQSADQTMYSLSTNKSKYQLLSYLGRVNYSLMNKYLFTASVRADGSSRFGENNKYSVFPSFAFGWKMGEEEFIENLNVFSNLKFRLSYGQTGNQDIGNYNSLLTFGTGPDAQLDQAVYTSYDPSRIPNADLKWETTTQTNAGFDMGFLENRIYGSVDYFYKITNDMLIYLPIPVSTGFGSILQNIGSIKNSGFEFMVTSRNITGDFSWTTSFNCTTLKNEVTDLGNIPEIIHIGAGWSDQIALIREGEALNSFYGYQVEGVWQEGDDFGATKDNVTPGDQKYADINGDSLVNSSDRVILGKSFPDFTWGLSNTFIYMGLSLDIFIEGVHGINMFNNNMVDSYFPVNFRRNKYAEPYLNRWTPENPSSEYPSFVNPNGQGNKAVNSYTVEDASYIRVRNVKLGYEIPVKSLNFIRRANIYVSGQNLLTITDYQGLDPATNSNGNPSAKIDYNSYPVARTILFGVEIGF